MIASDGSGCLHQQIIGELRTTVGPCLAFQVTEDVTALLVPAEKARSEREALVFQEEQKIMDKGRISFCWPAHGVSHTHDTGSQLSTWQGNLCQWFSLWLGFHCLRAHAPCCVLLSSSGMLSPKNSRVRKGSQRTNSFI